MSEIEFADIELKGDAEMSCGAWIALVGDASGVTVEVIDGSVCVGLDSEDELITPDTARSMASALNYYADQADKYKDGKVD